MQNIPHPDFSNWQQSTREDHVGWTFTTYTSLAIRSICHVWARWKEVTVEEEEAVNIEKIWGGCKGFNKDEGWKFNCFFDSEMNKAKVSRKVQNADMTLEICVTFKLLSEGTSVLNVKACPRRQLQIKFYKEHIVTLYALHGHKRYYTKVIQNIARKI